MISRLYTPSELIHDYPEPRWTLEPFLVAGGLTLMFAAAAMYKTFIAIDWASRSPGTSVYVTAEGSPRRFAERVQAWEASAGRSSQLLIHPGSLDLVADCNELVKVITETGDPVGVVVLDTLNRNTNGLDENSAQDMGRVIHAIDRLRSDVGCSVLVLHHVGHGDPTRERGSSALRGAADISIQVRPAAPLQVDLVCAKSRDSEEFSPLRVRLIPKDGSLVAAEAAPRLATIDLAVRDYLREHPDASARAVVREVPGRNSDVLAAYHRVFPALPNGGNTPEQGVPHPPLLKGQRGGDPVPLDPTLDGGW